MEIKEMQLSYEQRQDAYMFNIDSTLRDILKELQGRKNGKRKNKV